MVSFRIEIQEKMKTKTIAMLFNASLLLITVILFTALSLSRVLAQKFYSSCSYYLIYGLFILWLLSIVQFASEEKFNLKAWFKAYRTGIIISALIAAIVFISIKPVFRVLADETNLVGVSKSMLYEKRNDNVTMGRWYYDNFYPADRSIDKRPPLFPFLTSLVHTFSGYRAENSFALNFLVLFSVFLLIYVTVKKALGNIWALSSVILVASQPVVVQCATSGGFELLSALFIIVCFCCLKSFLEKPDSVSRFQLLWASLLMFATIRYEGVAAFFLVVIILAALRYMRAEFFKEGLSAVCFYSFIALIPNYLAAILIKNPWETSGEVFSVKHFVSNNLDLYKNLLDPHFYLPYAAIVNLIGAVAILYFAYRFLRGVYSKDTGKKHLIIISAACLLMNWIFYTSYYGGLSNHPSDSRFYVVFNIVLSVLALLFIYSINLFQKKQVYVLLFSVTMFILYHPLSVEDRFSRTQTLPREYRFVMDFLKQETRKVDHHFIVISARPGLYAVHNYGAFSFEYANDKIGDLLGGLNNHLYNEIFVIQEISYVTRRPIKDTTLSDGYVLEPVAESQIDGNIFVRISRVVLPSPRALPDLSDIAAGNYVEPKPL